MVLTAYIVLSSVTGLSCHRRRRNYFRQLEIQPADFFRAVEIGERAGDPQHAVIAARRQAHGLGRVAQKFRALRVWTASICSSSDAGASELVRICGSPAAV